MIKKRVFIGITTVFALAVFVIAGRLVYGTIVCSASSADDFVFRLPNEAGYYDITVDQLKTRIDDKSDTNFIIVDIRDDASYDKAHIPGAINIPLNELGYRLFSLDKSRDIIVYCFVGVTSEIACRILVNAGFKDVYNVTGGMKAWNYAVETSDGRINI